MSLRVQIALLLCALLHHTCEGTRGDDAIVDCCLDVSHAVIPKHIVTDYEVQDAAMSCRISAVIFITVKGKKLCAPYKPRWVRRLMRRCDRLKQFRGQ